MIGLANVRKKWIHQGRGGGSLEDLGVLVNEEEVARAIFRSTYPLSVCGDTKQMWRLPICCKDLRAPTLLLRLNKLVVIKMTNFAINRKQRLDMAFDRLFRRWKLSAFETAAFTIAQSTSTESATRSTSEKNSAASFA